MRKDKTPDRTDGVSVVVLTYNTPVTLLKTCIESIYRYNDIGDRLELIVVDNNSANQHEINGFVSEHTQNIQMVNNTANWGYGAGNNVGVKQTKYEQVLLINPDVELIEPIFGWSIQSFDKDRDLKLLGMQQIDQYNKKQHSFLARKLSVTCFLYNFVLLKWNKFSPRYSVVSGACFFLRKSAFLKIGGYTPNIFLYGEERYLHEHILLAFPKAKISIDPIKSYRHAISDRTFSLKVVDHALDSYFYLQNRLRVKPTTTYREVLNYYRFQILFYTLKLNKSTVDNTREIIRLIQSKFRK